MPIAKALLSAMNKVDKYGGLFCNLLLYEEKGSPHWPPDGEGVLQNAMPTRQVHYNY
jgi:hypothetical protein